MLLAIDTATQRATLALYNADGVYAEEAWFAGRNHTIELMPRLVRMLQAADIEVPQLLGLAVSLGPGSFTGLRIGLAVAKGLALPHKLPVIGVPTLDVVAYPFRDQRERVWAIAGAGRGRILTACYGPKKRQWQQLVAPYLTTFEGLAGEIAEPALCTGEIDEESAKLLERESQHRAKIALPAYRLRRAGYLAEIALGRLEANEQDDPDALVPIYTSSP